MADTLRNLLLNLLTYRGGVHYYLSTACLHGQHGYCAAPVVSRDGSWKVVGPSYSGEQDAPKSPAQCKFCPAQCRCRCHRSESAAARRKENSRG